MNHFSSKIGVAWLFRIALTVALTSVLFLSCGSLYSQGTMDLNYSYDALTGCNVFANGPTLHSHVHQTVFGYPGYTQNSVSLLCTNSDNGQYGLTDYAVAYHFKQGYYYNIRIYASGTLQSATVATPLVGIAFSGSTLPNTVTGTNCGDPTNVVIKNVIYRTGTVGTSYAWSYLVNREQADADYDYLRIAAIPSSTMENSNYVYVREVVVEEFGPAVITPAVATGHCGYPLTQTFTVQLSGTVKNVTGYSWDIPAGSPNTWLYNGQPAAFPIVTTGNSINLTSNCSTGTSTLSNINATVLQNNQPYTVVTATAGYNTSLPDDVAILGPTTVCGVQGTAQYTLSDAPSCPGSSVSWSFDQSWLASIVSQSGTQAVLQSGSSDGVGNVVANVTTTCGTTTRQYAVNVTPMPGVSGTYSYTSGGVGGGPSPLFGYNAVSSGSPGLAVNVFASGTGASSYQWTITPGYPSVPYTDDGNGNLTFVLGGGYGDNTSFTLNAQTPCGPASSNQFFEISGSGGSNSIRVSPNPVVGNKMTISLDDKTAGSAGAAGSKMIYAIKVTDLVGRVQKSVEYKAGIPRADVQLIGVQPGNYFISVYDGKKWKTKLIIMK